MDPVVQTEDNDSLSGVSQDVQLTPEGPKVKVNNAKQKQRRERSNSSSSDDSLVLFLEEERNKDPEAVAVTARPKNTGFKISVSNLPGSMSEQDFHDYFGQLAPHNYFLYKSGVQCGDMPPYSFAVINFLHKEDVVYWIEQVHGIVIVDQREEEFQVEIDIMLNQDLPKPPVVANDPLAGTIYDTEEFQQLQDIYEDTDGVFSDPPLPLELLQDIMIREIDERKAALASLQETPLSKYIIEKQEEEKREKSRLREEAAAALRKAKSTHKRKHRDRPEVEKDDKDKDHTRRERLAKDKLRKEASRRARKAAKANQETKRPASSSTTKTESSGISQADSKLGDVESSFGDEGPPVPRNPPISHVSEDGSRNDKTKEEEPSTSGTAKQKDRDKRNDSRYGSKPFKKNAERQSRQPKFEREGNWRSKAKSDKVKGQAASSNSHEGKGDTSEKQTVEADSEPKCEKLADIAEVPSTSTAQPPPSTAEAKKEPKKKIVKKIVRVKKLKNGETVPVAESGGDAGSSTSSKTKKSTNTGENSRNGDKPSTSTVTTASAGDNSKPNEKEKPKRSRPDREVYRPGAWRRNSGADRGQAQTTKQNAGRSSTEARQEKPPKQESGTSKQESGTSKQESGTSKQESGTSKQESGSSKQESGNSKPSTTTTTGGDS